MGESYFSMIRTERIDSNPDSSRIINVTSTFPTEPENSNLDASLGLNATAPGTLEKIELGTNARALSSPSGS